MYCLLSLCLFVCWFSKVYEDTFALKPLIVLIVNIAFTRCCVSCYYFHFGVCRKPSKCKAIVRFSITNTDSVRQTMHELRNTTIFMIFCTSSRYKTTSVILFSFTKSLQAHCNFIAILECTAITNMLQVLMCIYSLSPNEASKYAGKLKRSTLHQCRVFRPSCPTGFWNVFGFCWPSL